LPKKEPILRFVRAKTAPMEHLPIDSRPLSFPLKNSSANAKQE
jgi:hypothetical protein